MAEIMCAVGTHELDLLCDIVGVAWAVVDSQFAMCLCMCVCVWVGVRRPSLRYRIILEHSLRTCRNGGPRLFPQRLFRHLPPLALAGI